MIDPAAIIGQSLSQALLGVQQNVYGNMLGGNSLAQYQQNSLAGLMNSYQPAPISDEYRWGRVTSWADAAAEEYDRLTLWLAFYRWPIIGILFAPIVKSICARLEQCCDNAESWMERTA